MDFAASVQPQCSHAQPCVPSDPQEVGEVSQSPEKSHGDLDQTQRRLSRGTRHPPSLIVNNVVTAPRTSHAWHQGCDRADVSSDPRGMVLCFLRLSDFVADHPKCSLFWDLLWLTQNKSGSIQINHPQFNVV